MKNEPPYIFNSSISFPNLSSCIFDSSSNNLLIFNKSSLVILEKSTVSFFTSVYIWNILSFSLKSLYSFIVYVFSFSCFNVWLSKFVLDCFKLIWDWFSFILNLFWAILSFFGSSNCFTLFLKISFLKNSYILINIYLIFPCQYSYFYLSFYFSSFFQNYYRKQKKSYKK